MTKKNAEDLAKEIEDTTKSAREILELPEVTDWCSTGCTVLDLAISNRYPGGMPVGRIVQAYGGASTAKSVLATTILGYALRSGKHAFYADIEHTLDPSFAQYYGLDCRHENFHYGYSWHEKRTSMDQPSSLEEFFDEYLGGILKLRIRRPRVVVVDSITALPADYEVDNDMSKQGFGAYRAKVISLGLRKYINRLAEKQVTLFVVDQTRDAVGSPYAQETTTGGRGMEYYASTRIHLKHGKRITNSRDKDIGIWVNFACTKNKVAPPFRGGKFRILFDYGLDNVISNLSYLAEVQHGVEASFKLTTNTVLSMCTECKKLLFPGSVECTCGKLAEDVTKQIQHWQTFIESENREKELEQIVADVWAWEYRTPDRKARVW